MKILAFPNLNCSFGYKKVNTVRNIIDQITTPVRKATNSERKELGKALGISKGMTRNWQTQFNSYSGDIIEGEIIPNISVTAKGISPMSAIGNIINVELARIRGQLKRVSLEDINL